MKATEKTADGVEIGVETGYGNVTKVDPPKGRNARAEIRGDNLRLPVGGSVDTTDPPLWEAVQEAAATGRRISYRIEIHRDAKVDKTIPFAQLGKDDKFRRLVSLKPAQGAMAHPAQENGTPEPRPPVSEHDPGPSEPPPDDEPRRGPRIQEGKPWERENTDGSLNLGSYGYLAALSMVEWAYEMLSKRRAEKSLDGPPGLSQVEAFAAMLLDASDRAQKAIREDGRVDRMDASHTRSRGAVRCIIGSDGVPWDAIAQPEGRAPWVASVADRATRLLEMAKALDR